MFGRGSPYRQEATRGVDTLQLCDDDAPVMHREIEEVDEVCPEAEEVGQEGSFS